MPQKKQFTKTSLLRLNIPLGEEVNNSLKITNYAKSDTEFNIYLSNFGELASVSESNFVLGAKESKDIEIIFKDGLGEVEVYVGYLIIETSFAQEKIPIVLTVEDPSHAFAIIQSSLPKYDRVYPGGKLGLEIKVFDLLGANINTIGANYYLKNFEDELIISGEEDLVVGGSKTELIDIENNLEKGDYVFVTSIDYRGTKSISNYLFSVSDKEDSFFSSNIKILIIFLLVFFLGILGIIFYFIKTRDDLLVQLKKQQSFELKNNLELIRESEQELKKIKLPEKKKKVKVNALKKVRKKVVKRIKAKQKIQREELKKLKKRKRKKPFIKRKMEEWNKQGYKMYDTEKEIRKASGRSINKKLKEFKKQGYKTGFLKS